MLKIACNLAQAMPRFIYTVILLPFQKLSTRPMKKQILSIIARLLGVTIKIDEISYGAPDTQETETE